MKTFDIRKIYVCQIQEVNNLFEEQTDEDDYASIMGRRLAVGKKIRRYYELDERVVHYGLFVKGMTGYKHILTGTKYRLAGNVFMRIGEHVINPDNIQLFTKRERALASHLVDKYKSFDIDIGVIKALEYRINGVKCLEENEDILSK